MPAPPSPAYLLALLHLDGVGRVTAHRIARRFPTPAALRATPHEQVLLRLQGTPRAADVVKALRGPSLDERLETAEAYAEACTERRVSLLPATDERLARLSHLEPSRRPVLLHLYGQDEVLARPTLAVLSQPEAGLAGDAYETIQSAVREHLDAGSGVTVGFSSGFDVAISKLSTDRPGRLLAVVPSGLARLPRGLRPAATALIRNDGALLSPFEMRHGPFEHDQTERALVQAALGRAILLGAAPEDSAEARAARWAAEHDRAVFCVGPPPPHLTDVARPLDPYALREALASPESS